MSARKTAAPKSKAPKKPAPKPAQKKKPKPSSHDRFGATEVTFLPGGHVKLF